MKYYENLKPGATVSKETVNYCSVAIKYQGKWGKFEVFHSGLFHYDKRAGVKLLHLGGYADLQESLPDDSYFFSNLKFHRSRLRSAAAFCRLVFKANKNTLPYAFSDPRSAFNRKTGQFILGPTKLGLTCSSFVLAVLHAMGIEICDFDTWPKRDDDKDFQEAYVACFLKNIDPLDKSEIEKEIGKIRYRPTEISICSTFAPLKTNYNIASFFSPIAEYMIIKGKL